MPLEERVLEPIYVSRGIIDGHKDIYNLLPNELECFTNETLANIIKQLSSLSMYAEDLFASILQDASNLVNRTSVLQQKVNNLSIKVTQLDSTNEDVSLHDIHLKKPYKPQNNTVQEIFSKKTLPKPILELYRQCSKPPPLNILNQFRDDGKDSMKFYTNPNFFFELWRDAMLKQVEKEKNSKKLAHRTSNKMQNGLDKKPRQPVNSNERYRKMMSQQEFDVNREYLEGEMVPNRNVIYMSQNEVHYDQYDTIRHQQNNINHQQQHLDIYGTYNGNQQQLNHQQQMQQQQHYAYHNNDQHHQLNNLQSNYYGTVKNGNDLNYINNQHLSNGEYVDNNLIQNNINNCSKHPYNHNGLNNGGMHHHLPHQQMNGNYNNMNSITPPPTYQQDQYNQQQQLLQQQTLNRRSNTNRPSQPPPQPPPMANGHHLNNNHYNQQQNEYHQTNGHVNHYSQSNIINQQQNQQNLNASNNSEMMNSKSRSASLSNNNRDILPPPPLPVANQNNIPNPPQMPNNNKLNNSMNNNQVIPPAPTIAIPPPPPPMPNHIIANQSSDATDSTKTTAATSLSSNNASINSNNKAPIRETSFEQEILQKQKQLQPVKNINRPPPKTDPRNDLLAAIREGIKLRKVEDSKQKEVEKTQLLDVASILARRVAMELSDSSESENNENDDDWEDDESHV